MSQTEDPRSTAGTITTAVLIAAIAALAVVLVIKLRHRAAEHQGTTFSNGGLGAEHPAAGQKLTKLELDTLAGDAKDHLTLSDLRGSLLENAEDSKGKVVLLNFWGTWCQPCTAEMPHLAELDAQFHDRPDFLFLPVSISSGAESDEEVIQKTREFMARGQYKFQPYVDPGSATFIAAAKLTRAKGTPLTLVIDRHGTIRGVWPSNDPDNLFEIKQMLLNLLLER